MVYTQQRRRAMNKAVRELYPDIKFHESENGVPVMECSELPEGAVKICDAEDFIRSVTAHSLRENSVGLLMTDCSKALPVFIRSMELSGSQVRHYYRVNYVTASECSCQRAVEYINDGKLYAVIKDM